MIATQQATLNKLSPELPAGLAREGLWKITAIHILGQVKAKIYYLNLLFPDE
jgi:hypothetical protein